MSISARTPNVFKRACLVPAVIFSVACGCAQLKKATHKQEDVSVQRQERREKVVGDFERRRDDTQYRACLACWERGETRECETQLADLLERSPDHFEARLALADMCLEQGRTRAAEQQYRELIEKHPQQAQSHYSYGLFLDVAGRTDEAAEHFERAANIEPDNPNYVTLPASSGDTTEVATAATSAPATSMTAVPDKPDVVVKAAANLLQAGKAESALQLAVAASEKHPSDIRLKQALASAQFESGDPKSAQVTLQQALSLDKGNALTYFLLGYARKAQGDEETAQRHFAKARQLDPRLASQR